MAIGAHQEKRAFGRSDDARDYLLGLAAFQDCGDRALGRKLRLRLCQSGPIRVVAGFCHHDGDRQTGEERGIGQPLERAVGGGAGVIGEDDMLGRGIFARCHQHRPDTRADHPFDHRADMVDFGFVTDPALAQHQHACALLAFEDGFDHRAMAVQRGNLHDAGLA